METLLPPSDVIRSRTRWLDRQLSTQWCVLGWLVATATFIGLVRLLGGPAIGDSAMSVFSTWAIAHGDFACAYPPTNAGNVPFIAPLWPLVSGGFSALAHIGHNVPFPSKTAMGPHCSNAVHTMSRWAVRTNAYSSTIKIGYLSWLFVMAGVVAILRASGRGRCGWEPATLLLMACVPTVWMPLEQFFHPCDLVAMGLILCGVACVLRGWWGWAGVLLALAFTSQQFALLVLVPLVVVVPANRRARFVGMVAITAAIEVLPLVAMTSGRVLRAVVLGSGNPPSMGGTVLWEIHLNGAPLVIASRVLPIALSGTLAWWAVRRVGPHVLEAMPLLSLIATSLAFRLVFEVNLWGYYFMPITLALLMIDVIRGRIRVLLVAWLALVSLVFDPPPWVGNTVNHVLPIWLWQIILVPFVVALAVGPLLSVVRNRSASGPDANPQVRPMVRL